ncbi:MAG: hypothetical protein ABI333_16355 [bacterium]
MKTIHAATALCLLTPALGTLGGCKEKKMSDASDKKFQAAAKPFLGVYRITSRTRNQGSCAAEGKSLLDKDSEGFIAMNLANGFTGKMVSLTSCKDVANCKRRAAKPAAADFIYSFGDHQGKTLTGMEAFTGFSRGKKTCTGGRLSKLTLVQKGDGVVFELRGVTVSYPADERGYCSTKLVKEQAKGKPCDDYIVLRARRVSDL